MALSRRTGARFQASIWPGFVDAMTGLLLVLMFVLTIFMIVQFALRETITGQASKLDELSAEVDALAQALGLERDRNATLSERVGELTVTLGDARARQEEQAALIATLRSQTEEQAAALGAAQGRIASFEEQVAGLLSERDRALGQVSDLESERAELISEQEALQLALSNLRDEVSAGEEAARLAAARREALEALVADLRADAADSEAEQAELTRQVNQLETELSEEEKARLAEAAAAEALREKLKNADAELTSMTLALEEQRKRAEETLTLLAAAEVAQEDLDERLAAALLAREETGEDLAQSEARIAELEAQLAEMGDVGDLRARLAAALAARAEAETRAEDRMSEAEQRAVLLAQARDKLAEQQEVASEAQKQQALLNRQVAALREQLSQLQGLLDDARAREAASDVQLQSLGNELNTALARVAAEERRRREAEEARAKLLEEQKEDLERYRSEFFGRLRDVLGTHQGIRIEGDRFVFSSEVLFAPGEAELSAAGRGQIANVADILSDVIDDIPPEIDWVLQVDGHTDDVPVRPGAAFADNWELSQARALSVVRYMIDALGLPPARLSANGFGQYQPVNPADTAEARAQNRRIELKFTGK
ncbi:chemotaxis protein MotB [Roseovarius pacificus]|uniref:Chemotaxis protein MotB n=1 Tax=Roseovarius pacificus TaxID=337701 RepID=A0A1M7IVP1_9RHOB|nr:peptidoglycan -binding protein [Roseovarius pacificus]GGO61571.1 flagellar motor protein [Roseovarius pacificus]SHM44758.1 chemotaxis protein MotB [Roseovarius pacificus]